MRSLIATGFFLAAISTAVMGQMSKVTSAQSYMNYGELDKAREAIDVAVTDEKTSVSAKAWWYRAEIYMRILISEDEKVKALDNQALEKAFESYLKTRELDENKKFEKDTDKGLENCRRLFFNEGAGAFNQKDYTKAYTFFSNAVTIGDILNVLDSNAIFFGGQAAYYGQNYENAIPLFQKATRHRIKKGDAWYLLASAQLFAGDTLGWQKTISEGSNLYPKHKGLIIEEVNYYLGKKMHNEARDKLLKAIDTDPDNVTLYYNLGIVYENLKDLENAGKMYKKAIQIKPDHHDALYNLGALYYNRGVAIIQAADLLEGEAYNKEKAKADGEFGNALLYLEKAYRLNPEDVNTLLSLKYLYTRLDDKEKLEEVKKQLAVGGWQ